MALTRDFKETVAKRAAKDPAFAKALLEEAATLFLNGDPHAARLVLRDLVNALVGFEGLATATHTPSKSLHRMLSDRGNPSMDTLAAIFGVIKKRLSVDIRAQSVKSSRPAADRVPGRGVGARRLVVSGGFGRTVRRPRLAT